MPLKLLEVLAKYWKALVVLALCGLCYFWGANSHPAQVKSATQEQVSTQTVSDKQKVQQNDVVKTIDKKPNGEVVTTIVDHTTKTTDNKSSAKTQETSKTTSVQPVAAATVSQHTYSLGLAVDYPLTLVGLEDWNHPSYTVEVGKRVLGDVWVTGTYTLKDNIFGLGLRYEW